MTRLDVTPWARAQLTSEQRINLVQRTARLGADLLRIGASSPKGPFVASLNGGRWRSSEHQVFAVSAYGAADKLLAQCEALA